MIFNDAILFIPKQAFDITHFIPYRRYDSLALAGADRDVFPSLAVRRDRHKLSVADLGRQKEGAEVGTALSVLKERDARILSSEFFGHFPHSLNNPLKTGVPLSDYIVFYATVSKFSQARVCDTLTHELTFSP